jgi:hypothetical protein
MRSSRRAETVDPGQRRPARTSRVSLPLRASIRIVTPLQWRHRSSAPGLQLGQVGATDLRVQRADAAGAAAGQTPRRVRHKQVVRR